MVPLTVVLVAGGDCEVAGGGGEMTPVFGVEIGGDGTELVEAEKFDRGGRVWPMPF